MSKSPYHFRYHEDALSGMYELDLELRGAYTTLLDLMYSKEGYLEDDERMLAARMRVSTRKYRTLRDKLIQAGKIYYPLPQILSNHKVETEISRRVKRTVQAKLDGQRGGRKKSENEQFRNKNNEGGLAKVYPTYNPDKNLTDCAPNNEGDCGTNRSQKSVIDFQARLRALEGES